MKTIEQLEKEFDENFPFTDIDYRRIPMWGKYEVPFPSEVKNYIFQELLPQVLSEIIVKNCTIESYNNAKLFNEYIKQKAKEMGINLPE